MADTTGRQRSIRPLCSKTVCNGQRGRTSQRTMLGSNGAKSRPFLRQPRFRVSWRCIVECAGIDFRLFEEDARRDDSGGVSHGISQAKGTVVTHSRAPRLWQHEWNPPSSKVEAKLTSCCWLPRIRPAWQDAVRLAATPTNKPRRETMCSRCCLFDTNRCVDNRDQDGDGMPSRDARHLH